MLKDLANAIMARKEELYALSWATGGTRQDNWIDIEGGAGTLFAMSSKARRELPDDVIMIDGDVEPSSKNGTFIGQHVYTSLHGVAVQINAAAVPIARLPTAYPWLSAGCSAMSL